MSARLMVLGLLARQPQHGYEIARWLELSQSDRWADVLPGSIYHALRQMEKEGLVQLQGAERTGNRTRAVYAITEAGRSEFGRLLREGWERPARSLPAALYTLLTFSEVLPVAELRAAVERQIVALERELAEWRVGEQAKRAADVLPPWGAALFANGRDHIEADLRLLRSILELLA